MVMRMTVMPEVSWSEKLYAGWGVSELRFYAIMIRLKPPPAVITSSMMAALWKVRNATT